VFKSLGLKSFYGEKIMEISEEKITLEVEYEYEEFKRAYFDSLNKIPIFAAIINRPKNRIGDKAKF